MIRRVGIVGGWFAVTILAIGIAATAVGSVRGQVTDVPAIPVAGTAALLETTITTTGPSTIATEPPSTTTTEAVTTTLSPSTPTSTTAPPSPTTTAVLEQPSVTTHRLEGGQVTISALDPSVTLVAVVPAAGFSAEIEGAGPDRVEVEFESDTHKSSFRAEWEDGVLDVRIDEEAEDD